MLIRVFLHAEFISAMKTAHNLTIFMKNAKKNRKNNDLLIFWDFHWNSWAEYQKKWENMFFLDGKEYK